MEIQENCYHSHICQLRQEMVSLALLKDSRQSGSSSHDAVQRQGGVMISSPNQKLTFNFNHQKSKAGSTVVLFIFLLVPSVNGKSVWDVGSVLFQRSSIDFVVKRVYSWQVGETLQPTAFQSFVVQTRVMENWIVEFVDLENHVTPTQRWNNMPTCHSSFSQSIVLRGLMFWTISWRGHSDFLQSEQEVAATGQEHNLLFAHSSSCWG